ncbi:MAG: hypothetical protein ABR981_00215 [Candidatus Micrarchaeaceae archaeon]|jgi:hypothetical protein
MPATINNPRTTRLKGYEEEIVPNFGASHHYISYKGIGTCAIRIKMSESQFNNLREVKNPQGNPARLAVLPRINYIYDEQGFAEIRCSGYEAEVDALVVEALLFIGSDVKKELQL